MHISLDAALQRQPLLSTVGDKLLPAFPGAAAAYSLRALNGDANNVVRVRRDGDADGFTNERNFTAKGVQFELADWVNGKQETTLPGDVATPAAAYSLREVKDGYSGDVVRVRRESDDVEVDVALDANKEVSTSSAISNVTESPDQGDTTATTLGDFLTEATPARNRTGNARYDTFTPDGVTGFTAITNNVAAGGFDIAGSSGTAVEVSFDITLNSGSVAVKLRPQFESGGDVSNEENITTSGSKSFTLTSTADFKAMLFITASADFVVSNFSVNVPYNHTATVATWYDQKGSNDATQNTAASQPKIAEAGSLLADGIDFDGSDDHLDLNNVFTGTDGVSSFFVGNADTTAVSEAMFCQGDLSGATGSAYSVSSEVALRVSGSAVFDDDFIDANTLLLSVITPDAGTTTDAVAHLNGTQLSQTSSTGATLNYTNQGAKIGKRFASAAAYDGSLKELIIYDSDQSANRFKIESNINNHYGIYTAAEDGFVHTWYDQSGNSNDAVAPADDNEPQIVENGTYLEKLDFDGSNDFLETNNSDLSNISELSLFTVLKPLSPSANRVAVSAGSTVVSTAYGGWKLNLRGFTPDRAELHTQAQGSATITTATQLYTSSVSLISAILNGTNATVSVNGVAGTTNTSMVAPQNNTAERRKLRIGCQFTFQPAGFHTEGIEEVVLYTSDQTANQSAIEDNINNYYELYS